MVYEVDRIACRGLVTDLTLLIDIDTETGLQRAHGRNLKTQETETRMDEQAVSFHRKVRDAYHQLASDEPRRVRMIDGGRPPEAVARDVWDAVRHLFERKLEPQKE
jgi:dTMP kinase